MSPTARPAPKGALIVLLISAWAIAVVVGMVALTRYKSQPGAQAKAPDQWPASTALTRPAGLPSLVLFTHPRCPCTRATMTELNRLLDRVGKKVDARLLFILPPGTTDDFLKGELWDSAHKIPGLQVSVDRGGVEAARFGAATSGQVLLYAVDGFLKFRGGLTAARGHEGDSPGAERIEALLNDRHALASAPVFGCELANPEATGGTP